MAVTQTPLPWGRDALAPVISAETIDLHYGKHHKGYVDTLNGLIKGSVYEDASLEEIVRRSKADGETKIFNNAGQAWNHDLYWMSLTPGGAAPAGALAERIVRDFGDVETLNAKLVDIGVTRFGSGWVWLVDRGDRLEVVSTANAESPMADGVRCLLVLDVWEHAYYVDYQNRRADHLKEAVKLIDYTAASRRMGGD